MKPQLLQSELLSGLEGVVHAFTNRTGGVSVAPFDSLNMAQRVGDERESVATNRRAALDTMGRGDSNLVFLRQVHGDNIVEVNHMAGGSIEADGLWTRDHQATIGVLVADCVPILIAHRAGQAIAAVHAGWRGTKEGIIARMIERLVRFGFAATDLLVAMGPAIGPCCYEVDNDVVDALRSAVPESGDGMRQLTEGRWSVDLWSMNRSIVRSAGVPQDNIEVLRTCTSCTPSLFSHRRDSGNTGRQAGIIGFAHS